MGEKWGIILCVGAMAAALVALGATNYYGPVSEAHTDPNADVPWFFERTVLIDSGGKTSAGIIWDSNTIVTTQHGLNRTQITVTDARGTELPASVLFMDPYSDVAVLHAATGMEPLEASVAGPGDPVYAVGHPGGRPYAVTAGVISSVDRPLPVSVQHDAATFTGNSGGPVFDHYGGLVGMSAAMDDLSFSIPYGLISTVVDSVHATGAYSPGCVGMKLDGDTVRTVRNRVAGTIHPGDTIILVDGGGPRDLLYHRSPGDVVEVVMEDRTAQVRLGHMGLWFGIHACLD